MKRTTGVCIAVAVFFVCAGWLVASRVCSAPDTADLLGVAREGSSTSAKAIISGQGAVTVRRWGLSPSGGIHESETAYQITFSGDRYRVSSVETILRNTPGDTAEAKKLVGRGTVLKQEAEYGPERVVIYYPDEKAANIHATGHGSELRDIKPEFVGVGAIAGSNSPSAREVELNGASCILLEGKSVSEQGSAYLASVWVDRDKGFTVKKRSVFGQSKLYKTPVLLDEMTSEARDYHGVWGPGTCTKVAYRPDAKNVIRKSSVTTTTYSPAFEFNAKVDADALKLNLPSGTKVYDESLDATYVVP